MHGRSRNAIASNPYNAGMDHVGQPGRHCSHQARRVMRCSAGCMKDELHPRRIACGTDFGTLCVFSCIWMTASNYLIGGQGGCRASVTTFIGAIGWGSLPGFTARTRLLCCMGDLARSFPLLPPAAEGRRIIRTRPCLKIIEHQATPFDGYAHMSVPRKQPTATRACLLQERVSR